MNAKRRNILQGDRNQTSDYFEEGDDDKHGHKKSFNGAGNFLYVMLSDGCGSAFT